MAVIRLEGVDLEYEVVVRPRRRQVALDMDRHGRVRVLVPPEFEPGDIEGILTAKQAWLLRHYRRLTALPEVLPHRFLAGETFALLGRRLTLHLTERTGAAGGVRRRGSELWADVEPGGSVRTLLIGWYREQAQGVLPVRVEYWGRQMGVMPNRIKLGDYRSRWGYCRTDGLLALNWRLIQAPLRVVDYVVGHELRHLTHPHHGPRFWQALAETHPTFAESKLWLRDHGEELRW